MRLAAIGMMTAALAAILSACAPVDPDDAAQRAVVGGALGALTGAGIGATFAINPLLGAAYAAKGGAEIGAAVGVATAAETPTYAPIAVPPGPVMPGFYDNWPPAYHLPPTNTEAQPPHEG
jgi:hypothetical protein